MNLSRRQAILGAIALPLVPRAVEADGAALQSVSHPIMMDAVLSESADLSPASIETIEGEFAEGFNAYIQAMLEKSYAETYAIIAANTLNTAFNAPTRRKLFAVDDDAL